MLGEEKTIELFKPISSYNISTNNITQGIAAGHDKFAATDSKVAANVNFNVTLNTSGQIFCYFPSDYPREVKLTLDGTSYGTYYGNETHRILELGYYDKDDILSLNMTLKKKDLYIFHKSQYFYYLDETLFTEIMPKLSENSLIIDKYTEDSFEGSIVLTEDKTTVFTSIPYDKGWNVYVDGQKVETYQTLEALLAFDSTPGEHQIKMYYFSDAMKIGFTVSAIGTVLLILIVILEKYLKILYFKVMPKDDPVSLFVTNNDQYIIDDDEITGNDSDNTNIDQ